MNYVRNLKPAHLRLIVKIADFEQLQVAADSLAMSQPAASRMLSEVERAAETKLFERHPKGMTLTPAGNAFVRHARLIVDSYDSMTAEVSAINKGSMGEVRVGSVTGPAVRSLIPAILESKAASEHLEFTVEVGNSSELVRGLSERRLDFVLARLPIEYDSRNFNVSIAQQEEVLLMVRDAHPLAHKTQVQMKELLDFEWIVQERGSPIREAVEVAFYQDDLTAPARVTNSTSLLVVLAMLERTDCIAPLTLEVANLLSSEAIGSKLRTIDLSTTIFVEPYYLISNRDVELSSAAKNVMTNVLSRL